MRLHTCAHAQAGCCAGSSTYIKPGPAVRHTELCLPACCYKASWAHAQLACMHRATCAHAQAGCCASCLPGLPQQTGPHPSLHHTLRHRTTYLTRAGSNFAKHSKPAFPWLHTLTHPPHIPPAAAATRAPQPAAASWPQSARWPAAGAAGACSVICLCRANKCRVMHTLKPEHLGAALQAQQLK